MTSHHLLKYRQYNNLLNFASIIVSIKGVVYPRTRQSHTLFQFIWNYHWGIINFEMPIFALYWDGGRNVPAQTLHAAFNRVEAALGAYVHILQFHMYASQHVCYWCACLEPSETWNYCYIPCKTSCSGHYEHVQCEPGIQVYWNNSHMLLQSHHWPVYFQEMLSSHEKISLSSPFEMWKNSAIYNTLPHKQHHFWLNIKAFHWMF